MHCELIFWPSLIISTFSFCLCRWAAPSSTATSPARLWCSSWPNRVRLDDGFSKTDVIPCQHHPRINATLMNIPLFSSPLLRSFSPFAAPCIFLLLLVLLHDPLVFLLCRFSTSQVTVLSKDDTTREKNDLFIFFYVMWRSRRGNCEHCCIFACDAV